MHAKKYLAVIIGGGPAGLMAAEVITRAGFRVEVYDAMPSVGRKFLLAGVGGMNITHAEAETAFLSRFGDAELSLTPLLNKFGANELRRWVEGLGIDTFVGSSGRVFPRDMKAAPLLRAWLHRLRELGVTFFPRHRFIGWTERNGIIIESGEKGNTVQKIIHSDASVFALGGASWQKLGSNGAWVELFRQKNIRVENLTPSNCGFEISWSERLRTEHAGARLNACTFSAYNNEGKLISFRGEAILTHYGIEGTSIYALSRWLRQHLQREGKATLVLDLLPDSPTEKIIGQLKKPRGKNSLSNFLRKQLNLSPVKLALLREYLSKEQMENNQTLATKIKSLSINLIATRPIDEAISCAGGIAFEELTESLMLKKMPSVFCAGEMLDWEAPTGGYLLTACFATGVAAGNGVVDYLISTGSNSVDDKENVGAYDR